MQLNEFFLENLQTIFIIWCLIGIFLGVGLHLCKFFKYNNYFVVTLLVFLCILSPIGAIMGYISDWFFSENIGETPETYFKE